LGKALKVAKSEFIREFSEHKEVINSLKYTIIDFYRHKVKANRILASLDSCCEDYRAWRIEFCGFEFKGLGYDT